MRALRLLLLLAVLVGAGAPRVPLDPGDHWLSLRHDGRTRYLAHVPPAAASHRALPVLLSFHGAGGTPAGQQRFTQTDSLADREGFFVVYPEGTASGGLLTGMPAPAAAPPSPVGSTTWVMRWRLSKVAGTHRSRRGEWEGQGVPRL
jgi:poly(3-hydroxybutyrate) depolymerase